MGPPNFPPIFVKPILQLKNAKIKEKNWGKNWGNIGGALGGKLGENRGAKKQKLGKDSRPKIGEDLRVKNWGRRVVGIAPSPKLGKYFSCILWNVLRPRTL